MINVSLKETKEAITRTIKSSVAEMYKQIINDKRIDAMESKEMCAIYVNNQEKAGWYKLKSNILRQIREQYIADIVTKGYMSKDKAEVTMGIFMTKVKFPDLHTAADISEIIKEKDTCRTKQPQSKKYRFLVSKKDFVAAIMMTAGMVLILVPIGVTTPVGIVLVSGSVLLEAQQGITDGKLPFFNQSVVMETIKPSDLGTVKTHVFTERMKFVMMQLDNWMEEINKNVEAEVQNYM